jgi:hypothetical protein
MTVLSRPTMPVSVLPVSVLPVSVLPVSVLTFYTRQKSSCV